jgi:hypothetical protein
VVATGARAVAKRKSNKLRRREDRRTTGRSNSDSVISHEIVTSHASARSLVPTELTSQNHEHVVDVHVANLRRKLADDPTAASLVETVRGVGYRFSPLAAGSLSD